MGATPVRQLPYPEAAAAPLVHLDIKALAEAVDGLLLDCNGGPAITGAAPGSSVKFTIQAGSTVATTNAFGDVTISFPATYPTGLLTVVAWNGDDTAAAGVKVARRGATNTAGFSIRAYTTGTTAFVSAAIRVDWIAVGW